jgi:hypothetical protein
MGWADPAGGEAAGRSGKRPVPGAGQHGPPRGCLADPTPEGRVLPDISASHDVPLARPVYDLDQRGMGSIGQSGQHLNPGGILTRALDARGPTPGAAVPVDLGSPG